MTARSRVRGRRFLPLAAAVSLTLGLFPGPDTAGAQARTWEERSPVEEPSPRFGAGMAYDAARGEVVLFSGSHGMVRKDMWSWDGSAWSKISLPGNVTKPDGRFDAGMVYDATHAEVVLFGGATRSAIAGDTWTWDGSSWTDVSPTVSPSPRSGLAMAYDAASGEVVLFGGQGAGGAALADTWTWDGTTWAEEAPVAVPPARHHAAMAYDAASGEVVLFGGQGADGMALADTWTWDGTTWTEEAPATAPPPRSRSSIAFDPARQEIVLFGGTGVVPNNETWLWDGANWRELNTPSRPSARTDAAMTYDGANGEVVLFGGRVGNGLDDTWALVDLAPVEGHNAGAGTVSGTVRFAGDGVPLLGEMCEPTAFELEAVANVAAVNTVLAGYVGPVDISGTGANPCETVGSGQGSLDLHASGDGPSGSRIDCGPLRGQFTRVLADVTAVLTGPCIVNEFATGDVTFVARVAFHPTEGDGVNSRITEAAFEGAFAVSPE